MNTYYKVVTSEYMQGIYVVDPIIVRAESKPKNCKVQTARCTKYYDFFDTPEEAEDFASYMCDRNFGEDYMYSCSKYGKKKWECRIKPWQKACKDCEFSQKK